MFIVGKTFESQTDGVVRAQTGRERADNMDTPSVRSLSRHQSPGRNPDGAPDETTSIVHGQVQRDYQSTQTSGSRRRRNKNDAPPAEHGEQEDAAGGDGDGGAKKHWLRKYIDGIWSIELENKGSVARDHLALGKTPGSRPVSWCLATELDTDSPCFPFRTNVPRMAPDIPGIRIDRHSDHTAIPAQHLPNRCGEHGRAGRRACLEVATHR